MNKRDALIAKKPGLLSGDSTTDGKDTVVKIVVGNFNTKSTLLAW